MSDLISRRAAILAITGEPPEAHYPSWYAERIKALPSTPDSRQHGEWIDNHNGTFTCDQCGWKHSKSNFCPNCGAEMRGEKE